MTRIAGLDVYGARGQVVMMLLTILKEDGSNTRQGTCNAILDRGWFDIKDEDWPPYPSMPNLEPRWRTVVAWARKDAIEYAPAYLDNVGFNNWQISRPGRERYVQIRQQFERHELDVRRCYMWRAALKQFIDPNYRPSSQDTLRPRSIYRDELHLNRNGQLSLRDETLPFVRRGRWRITTPERVEEFLQYLLRERGQRPDEDGLLSRPRPGPPVIRCPLSALGLESQEDAELPKQSNIDPP